MSVNWNFGEQKTTELKSHFTKDADVAFDDFCKKFLNSSNGFFITPDFKQTELRSSNTNAYKESTTLVNANTFQKTNQVTRTVTIKPIKEITTLPSSRTKQDSHEKLAKKQISTTSQLIKTNTSEPNGNVAINMRTKFIDTLNSNRYASLNRLLGTFDEFNQKSDKLMHTIRGQDMIASSTQETCLLKNRSEVKLCGDPFCYYPKSNNTTMPRVAPKRIENVIKEKIERNAALLNKTKEKFYADKQSGNASNTFRYNYYGSLSINDFKSKLTAINTLNEAKQPAAGPQSQPKPQSSENKNNLQFKSQCHLNNKENNHSLVLKLESETKSITEANAAAKINLPRTEASVKAPVVQNKNANADTNIMLQKSLNGAQVVVTKEFSKILNEYLAPLENKTYIKTNNHRVSDAKY